MSGGNRFMKTITRSSISLFLTLIIVIGLVTGAHANAEEPSVSAQQTASLTDIDLDIITSNLTYSVVNPTQYDKIEVRNHIPAYIWDGENLVSSEQEVLFYPIFGDDDIVAILTVFDPLGDKSYTVGIDFAVELNNVLSSGVEDFFIVEAGSKLFLYSDGEAFLLKQYAEPSMVDVEVLPSYMTSEATSDNQSTSNFQGPVTDGTPSVKDSMISDYVASNSLNESMLMSAVESTSETYNYFDVSMINTVGFDITPKVYRPTRTIWHFKIGTLNQGTTEKCTYYATSLIGNFKSSTDYTPDELISLYGDTDGKGDIYDAQTCLSDYYDLDYKVITGIYGSAANEFITRGWPLYAAFYDSAWTLGHALAVCGYDDSGNAGIYVSETLTNSYKSIYPSSTNTYVTRAYSTNCYWSQTLYYKYW